MVTAQDLVLVQNFHLQMEKISLFFGAYMSSCVHIDNKNKSILIPGKGRIQGLDDSTSWSTKYTAVYVTFEG